MASFQKRGGAWRALIRRKGHPAISNTFDTKAEAEAWARKVESEIDRGQHTDHRVAESITFSQCLTRYYNEISVKKKSHSQEKARIRWLLDHPLAKRSIGSLRAEDFARYRDARLKEVAPATARLELALISHLFTTAIREWAVGLTANPIRMIAKPRVKNERNRRLEGDEEARLFAAIDAIAATPIPRSVIHPKVWFRPLVVVALETGMRQGELLSMTWDNLRAADRFVLLPDTKNGDARRVPLTRAALAAIETLPRLGDHVFPISAEVVKNFWNRAISDADIEDFHFHDLRHEATSRMARKLPMHDLMKVTGHKTAAMLSRYYHPVPADLAAALDA